MSQDHKQSLRDHVLERIESGTVTMRPKWYFVLRAMLAVVGIGIIALTLLYLGSFVLFMLRRSGIFFVPIFGFRGWFVLVRSLPWLLLTLMALFIVVLELLVRHYSFAYRKPLAYSALGIIVVVLVGGHIVARTSFHHQLMREAQQRHLPFAEPFYRQFAHPHFRNVHRGTITQVMPDRLMLDARDEESLTVIITPQTRLPLGADFAVGDMIVVFGDRTDHTIRAFGIRKVDDASSER